MNAWIKATPRSATSLVIIDDFQTSHLPPANNVIIAHCCMYLDCSWGIAVVGCEKLLGVLWHKVRQLLLSCSRVEDNSSRMICWVVVKRFIMAEVKRDTESKNTERTRISDMHWAQWNATGAWMCVSSQQSAHRTAVTSAGAHDDHLWDETLLAAAECSKWCHP